MAGRKAAELPRENLGGGSQSPCDSRTPKVVAPKRTWSACSLYSWEAEAQNGASAGPRLMVRQGPREAQPASQGCYS